MIRDDKPIRIQMPFGLYRDLLMSLSEGHYDADPAMRELRKLLEDRLARMVERENYAKVHLRKPQDVD